MPQIKIRFAKDGTSTVATEGFTGESCLEASKFVEDALGTSSSEKKTSEYYDLNEHTVHLEIQDEDAT
jgi:hypothetical protein